MKKFFCLTFFIFFAAVGICQSYNVDSALHSLKVKKDSSLLALRNQRDSSYRAMLHGDTVKTEKEFADLEKWEKLKGIASYPAIKGGEQSGVLAVDNITEVPDPKMEYKLLFELTRNNPDSLAKDVNYGLTEISRIINLHVAAGIPIKNISPVIVVHAAALKAITTNEYYKEQYKISNPNLTLINDLKSMGAKFIACGQAMHFFDVKRESLLPNVKVSLTAQTVLSSYQLKGYVLYWP